MAESLCKHPDIRKFDGIRCCLSCGEAVFEVIPAATHLPTDGATCSYKYTKLNYKLGYEVRLVLLLPDDSQGTLRCEITHVNLDDDPVYDAISYTWATEDGHTTLSNAILCVPGGTIPITANCDAVLRHLKRHGSRRLWIDAICIDQNNLDERNHQVGLMDRIYTRAASVFSCIHSLTPIYKDLFRELQRNNSWNYSKRMASRDLNRLFSSRYFDRVWVIQEVALARAAYLLVNDDVLPLTAHVIDRMKDIQAGTKMLPSVLRWSLGRKTKLGIIACLHASSSCQATDPRDRVYAVMGLMEAQAKSLIPVNYSSDLQTLYRIVIAAIIITQKNLDVLLFSAINQINPGADWRAESCLSIKAFQRYLDSTNESPESNVHESEVHKLFVKPNPWCATITVAAVQDFCDFSGHENVSCLVEIPQDAPFGLLPRLRVRAHYIDSVCVVDLGNECADSEVDNSRGSLPIEDIMSSYPLSIFEDIRVTNCFRRDATSTDDLMPEAKMVSNYDKSTRLDININDLLSFQRIGANLSFRQRMFTSRFSVGFRPFDYPPTVADEIFAIDGTKELFIMRRTADQKYRIVSKCYLWAAWELDCWNPGTRKGRWGPSLSRPTFEQTRMIEIY